MSAAEPALVKYCLIDGEIVGSAPYPADAGAGREACLQFCKHALQAYWVEGVRVENPDHHGAVPDLVLVEDPAGHVIAHWSKDDQLRDLIDRPFGWSFPLWSISTQTLRQAIQLAGAEARKGRASGPIVCQSHHIEVDEAQSSRIWHRLSTPPGMPVAESLAGVHSSDVDHQEYRFQGRCQFEPHWIWEVAVYSTATAPGAPPVARLHGSIVSVGRGEAARNATHSLIEVAIDDWVKEHAAT